RLALPLRLSFPTRRSSDLYELELNFIDRDLEPAMIGTQVRDGLQDTIFTPEFARFNLEINSQPLMLKGGCFSSLATELSAALNRDRKSTRLNSSHVKISYA